MSAEAIRARAVAAADRAIASSRNRLGEHAWVELGEWVEDNVIALAKQWAIDESRKPRR